MESKSLLSPSSALFLCKLKTFLESKGITFEQFFLNLKTVNHNLISLKQFLRVITLIHMEAEKKLDPQKVFLQLSNKKQTILLPYLKKYIKKVDVLEKNKILKKCFEKLYKFVKQNPDPVTFFQQFAEEESLTISKSQFNKLLVATDIKQFGNQETRKMLTDYIYRKFSKQQISVSEYCSFFKVQLKKPQKIQQKIAQQNQQKVSQMVVQKKSQKSQPSPKKEEEPQNQIIISGNKCYPLSMRYYRLGQPEPYKYTIIQQFEDLLKKNAKYIDKQNPQTHLGTYVPASNIFTHIYHIFEMSASVLMRQKSRIGIAQSIQPKDIIQGQLGDCYFLSSIASLISKHPQTVQQRFLFDVNPANYYAVELFIDGEWTIITTDDQIPCNNSTPVFASPHGNQIWVMLLQKCWAKVFGSYKAIATGNSGEGFLALTGAPCETISQKDVNTKQQYIKDILKKQSHYVATTSGSDYLKSLQTDKIQDLGLIPNHAYSLLKIITVNGINLIRIRNPWGSKPWKGDWSFQSNKWTQQLRNQYNYNKCPKDGSFYMCWDDFCKFFGDITICKINPNFVHDSIRHKSSKRKSGYFQITVSKQGQYIMSIYQVSKRKMCLKYSNYEFSDARLIILKRQENGMKYIGSISTFQQQICTLDLNLQEGDYIISAKVFWKFWDQSQMILTSYGKDHINFTPIQRSIAPKFKQNMIKSYIQNFAGSGEIKSYLQYDIDATLETNFDNKNGIGFMRMVNRSQKNFKVTQSPTNIKGVKLIKPDQFPLVFDMVSKSEKSYGFLISPSYKWHLSGTIQYI